MANESSRKVLKMLLAFTPACPRLSVDQLAAAIGTPKSSAYRYLGILRDLRLVEEDGRGGYQLTVIVSQLAGAANAVNGIRDVARPIMESVRDTSRETVLLYKRVRDKAVCIELMESSHPIRLTSSIGTALPIDAGAATRVLLAYMPPGNALLRKGSRTSGKNLDAIRKAGFAESIAELSPDVWAAAAPVFERSQATHSLVIAGPAFRLDLARRRRLVAVVRRAAAKISNALPE